MLALSGDVNANLAVQDKSTSRTESFLQRFNIFKFYIAVAAKLAVLVSRQADGLDVSAAEEGSNIFFGKRERQVANKGSVRRVGGQVNRRTDRRTLFGVITFTIFAITTFTTTTFVVARRTITVTTTTFVITRRAITALFTIAIATTVAEYCVSLTISPVIVCLR